MLVELEGHVTDPAAAWTRLGDTDFLNRAAGGGKLSFRLEPRQDGAPEVAGEMAGPLGTRLAFREHRNAWVWHRWFRQDRRYERAPIAESRFELRLDAVEGGVVPRIRLELEPSTWVARPVIAARGATFRSRWQAVLDALPKPGQRVQGATRRPLAVDAVSAFDRWSKVAPPPVVDAVRSLVETERDQALTQLRPFEVADRFGLDRHETLVGMLRAVRSGALELYWSVRCRRCSGEVASTKSLSDLADHAGCASCRIAFEPDLGRTVEVLFAPHPAVLPRVGERFCTMFPTGAPQLRATFGLAPGEVVDDVVELPPGRWIVGPGGDAPDLEVEVTPDAAASTELVWAPGVTGVRQVAAGEVRLRILNENERHERVILADAGDADAFVPASLVATLPEFRRELGTQVLAPDVRIGTRSVALLFTDLSGSTAMYEAVGDARAYALVRDHFRLLSGVVEKHGGVVVKTIGDAVMASFHSCGDAFEAALEMRTAFDGFAAEQDVDPRPRLNVGLHTGPALAVHSDAAGLDWFGRTVNLAARAQASARGGELVLTEEVRRDRRVAARIDGSGAEPVAFDADLKGIGAARLYKLPPP